MTGTGLDFLLFLRQQLAGTIRPAPNDGPASLPGPVNAQRLFLHFLFRSRPPKWPKCVRATSGNPDKCEPAFLKKYI